MVVNRISPYASLRKEVSERLYSFFVASGDGRATSLDTGGALASSQGPHRPHNEDRSAIVRLRFGSVRTDLRLAIVCDGMGGMAKGGEAAATALGSFIASCATIEIDCPLDRRLEQACLHANSAVFEQFAGEAGTTLTAIAFANRARYAVHVGDSRLYGLDKDMQLALVTKDDTVSNAVNAHLGVVSEDEMDNRLLQFVGIGDAIQPSVIDVTADSYHNLWLLTSDGAHSVGRRTLSAICEGSRSSADLVRKLVYVSEAMNTQDNATAICIRSGFVKATDEEHEGLTLQVTAPDRNLEIWLPPSAVNIAVEGVPAKRSGQDDGSAGNGKAARVRLKKAPQKHRVKKLVRTAKADKAVDTNEGGNTEEPHFTFHREGEQN